MNPLAKLISRSRGNCSQNEKRGERGRKKLIKQSTNQPYTLKKVQAYWSLKVQTNRKLIGKEIIRVKECLLFPTTFGETNHAILKIPHPNFRKMRTRGNSLM